jgi:hypothetical protein
MRFLEWLFGKKEESAAVAHPQPKGSLPVATEKAKPAPAVTPKPPAAVPKSAPLSEAENLRRWRESGQPRQWVEARQGRWDHAAWLSLLADLERSPYWPLSPDEVGKVLEEVRQEWLRRN